MEYLVAICEFGFLRAQRRFVVYLRVRSADQLLLAKFTVNSDVELHARVLRLLYHFFLLLGLDHVNDVDVSDVWAHVRRQLGCLSQLDGVA